MAQGLTGLSDINVERVVTLTDAANIDTDASLGSVFKVTLGGNRTLNAPTNPTSGQKAVWRFKQDGTGSRTITLNAIFRVASDISAVTLSTAAGTADYMAAIYDEADNKWDVIAFTKGIL
jgi:predicted secreted protein